jgi:hypothetical protein
VDIIATVATPGSGQRYAEVILEDVEVLAVNTEINKQEGQVAKPAERVTLRLTEDQLTVITAYAEAGNLRLAKRRPDDKGQISRLTFEIGRGSKKSGPQTPAKPPEPAPTEVVLPPVTKEPPKPQVHTVTILIGDNPVRRETLPIEPEKPKEKGDKGNLPTEGADKIKSPAETETTKPTTSPETEGQDLNKSDSTLEKDRSTKENKD